MGRSRARSPVHGQEPWAHQDRELRAGRRADLHALLGPLAELPETPGAGAPDLEALGKKVRLRGIAGVRADLDGPSAEPHSIGRTAFGDPAAPGSRRASSRRPEYL